MSRWSYSNRDTVEDCRIIDIFWLNRHGYLKDKMSGTMEWNRAQNGKSRVGISISIDEQNRWSSHMRLTYTFTDYKTHEKTDNDYKISLVSTPCNFGSKRYWFICSLSVNGRPCNRRVAKLFLPPGGRYFGCRHCHDLTYKGQKEHNRKVDMLLKNPDLMERLCKTPELLNVRTLGVLLKACFRLEERYGRIFGSENVGKFV